MKRVLLLTLPLLALIAVGLLWWQLPPTSNQPTWALNSPLNCDLHHHDCHIQQDDLQVSLSIHPQPIPIAKSLQVHSRIQGLDIVKVQLDINGVNMYMGYNRVTLNSDNGIDWHGKSILSFCTIDQMQWQLTLLIDLADGTQVQAPFPLVTPYIEPTKTQP